MGSPRPIQKFDVQDALPSEVIKGVPLAVPDVEWMGWTIMKENPEDIVLGFLRLRIDNRYKLRAYQYTSGHGATGLVWAIPHDMELPHPAESEMDDGSNGPKPSYALDDFMTAIQGDFSPLSYLQAAVLAHELMEFGAEWHGVGWGAHKMLPFEESIARNSTSYSSGWKMEMEEPDIWDPHFYYSPTGQPTVIFYTIDDVWPTTINRFTHTFSKENYTMKIKRDVVATGRGGMIF